MVKTDGEPTIGWADSCFCNEEAAVESYSDLRGNIRCKACKGILKPYKRRDS